MDTPPIAAWVRLYHPSGALVTIPICALVPEPISQMIQSFLDAGFTVDAPGLEEGERKEVCGWIVRREKVNKNGSISPIIDLYVDHDALKHPSLTIYLDSEDDIKAFESASGHKIDSLPLYEGEGRIERDKNPKLNKYVKRVDRPFGFAYIRNPSYDPEKEAAARAKGEVYPVPKRKFSRWTGEHQPRPEPAEAKPIDTTEDIEKEVRWWKAFLSSDPPVDVVSRNVRERLLDRSNRLKKDVFSFALSGWVAGTGAEWDKKAQKYVLPRVETDPAIPEGF